MKMLKKLLMVLVPSLLLMGMGNALAASPVGQWNVTFYLEPGLTTAATQGICFTSSGTWFSTTFSSWNGDYFQKGDRFRWYGHTSGGLGTAEFGQFVHNAQIAGEFAHFFPGTPPVTSSRGNWRASKVGNTCNPPASPGAAPAAPDPSSK